MKAEVIEDRVWSLYINGNVWQARDLYLHHVSELCIESQRKLRMIYFVHLFCSRFIIDKRIIDVDAALANSVDRLSEELRLRKGSYQIESDLRTEVLTRRPVYLAEFRNRNLDPDECLAVEHWIAMIDEFDIIQIDRQSISSWELQVLYFYMKLYVYDSEAHQVMVLHNELFPFSDFANYVTNVESRIWPSYVQIQPIAYSFTLAHVAQCLTGKKISQYEHLRTKAMLIRSRLKLGHGSLWKFVNV